MAAIGLARRAHINTRVDDVRLARAHHGLTPQQRRCEFARRLQGSLTGNTLRANQLIEVEHIMDISSRLVVNQAALKLKQAPIRKIIDAFASAIAP